MRWGHPGVKGLVEGLELGSRPGERAHLSSRWSGTLGAFVG